MCNGIVLEIRGILAKNYEELQKHPKHKELMATYGGERNLNRIDDSVARRDLGYLLRICETARIKV